MVESSHSRKIHFNVAFLGDVDCGKSTIIGHMLYKKMSIDHKEMAKSELEASKAGK